MSSNFINSAGQCQCQCPPFPDGSLGFLSTTAQNALGAAANIQTVGSVAVTLASGIIIHWVWDPAGRRVACMRSEIRNVEIDIRRLKEDEFAMKYYQVSVDDHRDQFSFLNGLYAELRKKIPSNLLASRYWFTSRELEERLLQCQTRLKSLKDGVLTTTEQIYERRLQEMYDPSSHSYHAM